MSNVQIFAENDPQSFCEIDLVGCSIARLVLEGKEILWSGDRPDGSKGITHPCIPNFNIAEGLPNHGPARKATWEQLSSNSFSWTMEEIPEVYTAGITATRTFEVQTDSFKVTTTIENNSPQSLPINIAEHHYFPCPASERSEVNVNNKPFDENALNGTAKFTPNNNNFLIIEVPHLPLISMDVHGYGAFAQWSQPDSSFVCVEPIQVMPMAPEKFLSDAPQIKAGETKTFAYKITIEE